MTDSGVPRAPDLLSVVAPLHDEETNVRPFCERVFATLGDVPFELLIVDDGSRDATPTILRKLAAESARVKVITLSRRFGHQAALTAGLEHAAGDAVVTLDGDLQDPPELIPTFLEHWVDGADVVYGVREQRSDETRLKLWTARLFYRLLARIAQIEVPLDAGDYRLMDRRALDAMLAMPERSRFLRGMSAWIGFRQTAVPYHRDGRMSGETKFTLRRMARFALDAVSSLSFAPLQAATVLGFTISAFAFLLIPIVIIARFMHAYVAGISTTLVTILLLGGIQLITVGIIGEYVGRIYDEVKSRPLYVIRSTLNVPEAVGRSIDQRERERAP